MWLLVRPVLSTNVTKTALSSFRKMCAAAGAIAYLLVRTKKSIITGRPIKLKNVYFVIFAGKQNENKSENTGVKNEKINDKGATFRSLTEPISTGTIGGDMFMLMVKTFADFERESLKLRTKNGITAAKAMGRIGGRKPKLTQSQRNEAIEMVMKKGKTTTEVARLFKVSAATISRLVTKTKTLKSLDEK